MNNKFADASEVRAIQHRLIAATPNWSRWQRSYFAGAPHELLEEYYDAWRRYEQADPFLWRCKELGRVAGRIGGIMKQACYITPEILAEPDIELAQLPGMGAVTRQCLRHIQNSLGITDADLIAAAYEPFAQINEMPTVEKAEWAMRGEGVMLRLVDRHGNPAQGAGDGVFASDVRTLQRRAWQHAHDKGFHDALNNATEREPFIKVAELAQPLWQLARLVERRRNASDPGPLRYEITDERPDHVNQLVRLMLIVTEVAETIECIVSDTDPGEELADIVIRVMDMAGELGIDLEAAILAKMAYNEKRPTLHGKAF